MKQLTSRRFLIGAGVIALIVLILIVGNAVQAPTGPGPQPTANNQLAKPPVSPDEPQIFILEPNDGASVNPLTSLRVGASNFKFPLESVVIHIAVDVACAPPGEIIPEDGDHKRFDRGLFQAPALTLSGGPHRLCIQASAANDIALDGAGMMRVIDVDVVIPPTDNG